MTLACPCSHAVAVTLQVEITVTVHWKYPAACTEMKAGR